MAFNVFDDPDARAGFFVNIFAMPICTLTVLLRFVNNARPTWKVGWEDWFALLALIFMIIYASLETVSR